MPLLIKCLDANSLSFLSPVADASLLNWATFILGVVSIVN